MRERVLAWVTIGSGLLFLGVINKLAVILLIIGVILLIIYHK